MTNMLQQIINPKESIALPTCTHEHARTQALTHSAFVFFDALLCK